MRSHEERVSAVKRRVAEQRRKRQRRRDRGIISAAVAACLGLIVALSAWLPAMMDKASAGSYAGHLASASMFAGSAAVSYLVIGLLSFVLGVCVTILCFRIRSFQREERETEAGDDRTR